LDRADLAGRRYEKGITPRRPKAGDKGGNEETLPVETVGEYFKHDPLPEIHCTCQIRVVFVQIAR